MFSFNEYFFLEIEGCLLKKKSKSHSLTSFRSIPPYCASLRTTPLRFTQLVHFIKLFRKVYKNHQAYSSIHSITLTTLTTSFVRSSLITSVHSVSFIRFMQLSWLSFMVCKISIFLSGIRRMALNRKKSKSHSLTSFRFIPSYSASVLHLHSALVSSFISFSFCGKAIKIARHTAVFTPSLSLVHHYIQLFI